MKTLLISCVIFLHSAVLNADLGLITVPKSGTHLILALMNQIEQMTGKIYLPEDPRFWHTCSIPERTLDCEHICLGVRDPRDTIISTVYWYDKLVELKAVNFSEDFLAYWTELSFREKVQFLIQCKSDLAMKELQNMMEMARCKPLALIIKYEDLVGERGGGDDKLQYQTIMSLLSYLNINPDELDIESLQSGLYGGSPTFREGKIGVWKKYPYPQDFEDDTINQFLSFFDYS